MLVNALQHNSKFKSDALTILPDRFWISLKGLGLNLEADQHRVLSVSATALIRHVV